MKVNLIYNEFKKEIELDISLKIGNVQEQILQYCSLMIYNIEYSEIIINDKSYILGDDNCKFDMPIEHILNEQYIDKIIIYDN